ncbi:MAG: hypothetical protein WCX81_03695, partial [Monoglobales bacterium]
IVKEDAYNDDMQEMIADAKEKGYNLKFFIGYGKFAFDTQEVFKPNGVIINGKDIYVRYDGYTAPQQIKLHEYVHADEDTEIGRVTREKILNSLSDIDKKKILESELYKQYMELYNGNKELVWKEFVANVLSGQSEYASDFTDIRKAYWNNDFESINNYKVAEYAASIDAGGNADVLDNIGFGDKYSISYNNDGSPNVVLIEEDIFKGHGGEMPHKVIRDYLRNNIGKYATIIESGQKVYLGKDLPNEYTQFKSTRLLTPTVLEAKNQSSQNLSEMVEIATGRIWAKNTKSKHAKDSKFGWYKYSTRFRVGNKDYKADLLIRNDADGKKYIYDVINIKETVIRRGELTPYQRTINNDRPDISGTNGFNNTTIPQDKSVVNSNIRKNDIKYSLNTYDEDAEQNNNFWDEWINKAKEYGVIPKGENPVRDVDVPKKISNTKVVSRFARTMLEAGVTPDETVSTFEKAILNGDMAHEVITNKKSQSWARQQIEYLGFEEALNRWSVLSESGKVGKNELALGMELYNQCITNKDVHNAMKIAAELVAEATRVGQTLQACRMLKLMTPDGQLYYLEKSIQKMNDEFRDKIGDKYKDIELDEKLMEEFLGEKDEEKRNDTYAVKEAQAATYRDANSLAEGLNRLQKRLERSSNKAVRATSVLVEGVMPFKKTPLNIAKQGVNYSPIGILKGIYKLSTKLKNGDATANEIIDDIAKGLTGTGMMLLGLFLASMGLLIGSGDKPEKEKEFDKMVGEQSYAFKIKDAFTYTIDWMTPSNLSLFIGAKLYELTKDKFSFADIVDALSTVTEPLLELSVFSGLNGVIESAKYSDSEALLAIGSNIITSYLLQALPTTGGQLSRMIDKNKREYYFTDKNSNIPKTLQRFIGQASSKIPFASYLFEPSVDAWGREEEYGNIVERAFKNTVSPGYYSKDNYTKVDTELKKLYDRTGESSVLPTTQQKYYVSDKTYYYMNAKDYIKVKKSEDKIVLNM